MSSKTSGPDSGSPKRPRKRRIFIGLTDICGYYSTLHHGFRSHGVDSVFVPLWTDPFGYEHPVVRHSLVRLAKAVARRRQRYQQTDRLRWFFWAVLQQFVQIVLLAWAATQFDTFVFGARSTFISGMWDLGLLRMLGKKVLCVFHGSDSRPPYFQNWDGEKVDADPTVRARNYMRRARLWRRQVRRVNRFVDYVIDHPLWCHFHIKPIISFCAMGIPQPAVRRTEDAPEDEEAPVRLLHCPSNPHLKGTLEIRRMVRELQEEGFRVEYAEISGRPNEVVLQELRRCDLVIDELYSEVPLAGLGSEAARFAKPTLVGGHAGEEQGKIYLPELFPPSHYCEPEEVPRALRTLVRDAALRRSLGRRARDFVSSEWSARAVAGRFLRVIEGDIPQSWWYDPGDVRYVFGATAPREFIRTTVRLVLERGGRGALLLEDKPAVEEAVVRFAIGDDTSGFAIPERRAGLGSSGPPLVPNVPAPAGSDGYGPR